MSGDYLIRQIENMTRFLAQVILGRQPDTVQITHEDGSFSQGGFLAYRLGERLARGDVNGAENLLFTTLEEDSLDEYLPIALDFYERLNGMTDMELDAAGFSRGEIADGLRQVCGLYGAES